LLVFITVIACKKSNTEPAPAPNFSTTYFPPIADDTWEKVSAATLGWDAAKLDEAIAYGASTKTYGLIILYKGRIVTKIIGAIGTATQNILSTVLVKV
jgi:hypothetical protein